MAAATLAANRSSLAWGRVVKVGAAAAAGAVALNAAVAATGQPAESVLAQQLGGAFLTGGASGESQAPQPAPVQPPPASSFMSPALARSLMRREAEGAAAAAKAAAKKRPAAAQRSKEAESSADDEEVEDEGGAAGGSGAGGREGRWLLRPEPRPDWITVPQFNMMNVKERREAVLARDVPYRDELILVVIIFVARQANAGVGPLTFLASFSPRPLQDYWWHPSRSQYTTGKGGALFSKCTGLPASQYVPTTRRAPRQRKKAKKGGGGSGGAAAAASGPFAEDDEFSFLEPAAATTGGGGAGGDPLDAFLSFSDPCPFPTFN